jgi:hypothetical protein
MLLMLEYILINVCCIVCYVWLWDHNHVKSGDILLIEKINIHIASHV